MSEFVVRNYQASDREAVINLYRSISEKYEESIFWWPGEEKWTWEYAYCAFEGDKLIGKGQVMPVNVVSESSHPDAKHTIFLNIKTHPDWEEDRDLFDALFRLLLAKAKSIRATLPSSRGAKLCVGNYATEVTNTQHYLDKGFTHFKSLFWMERDLSDKIEPVQIKSSLLEIKKWRMETNEEEQQYLDAEQEVFKEDADGIERIREWKSRPNWVAIGAFHQGTIVGDVMAWQEEESKGMIESVFVKPNWRRLGIARFLLTEGVTYLKTLGLSKAELLVLTDNDSALNLYTSVGFKVSKEEPRYWIDLG